MLKKSSRRSPRAIAKFGAVTFMAVLCANLLTACSDPLNDVEVISLDQFGQNAEARQKMLQDCKDKEPKDVDAALKFMATKYGQSCSNAQVVQAQVDRIEKIKKAEAAMRERDNKMFAEMRNYKGAPKANK
jgi:hypothetical protein